MSQNFNPTPAAKPFYAQDWFIIVMLIFCGLPGLILMWVVADWSTTTKIIVTVVLVLAATLLGVGSNLLAGAANTNYNAAP